LADLCERYWYPLYVFVRSRGHSPHDAQDLTQGFFARLLASGGFTSADPERGRFRSWLLGAMKHFLANQWHRDQAEKRGGKVAFLEWDALDPESRYAAEPALADNPDAVFDREWALAGIGRAMEKLRLEAEASGKCELFQALKPSLSGEEPPRSETAARLGMTEAAVKVAVHRMRQRYRDLLRAEVAQTVAEPSDLEDEMRHLVAVLRGS
jgi:RNA polymerase sigma-70 factor (ECF subfamily)